NLTLFKRKVQRIQGRVLAGSNSGPLARIQLMLVPNRPQEASTGLAEMTTMATAQASFEFQGVQPGSYYLMAIRLEPKPQTLGRMPIDVGGHDLENLVFSLGDLVDVTGAVRVEGGNGVISRGIVLSLLPSEGPALAPPCAPVSESGVFHIAGV